MRLPAREPYETPSRGTFDPATSQRDASKSSEAVTYYTNADGSVTTTVSAGRANYRAPDGTYQQIDTTLVAREDRNALARPGGQAGDLRLESTANDLVVSLAGPGRSDRAPGQGGSGGDPGKDEATASWRELASVTLPSGEVFGYSLVGARPVPPKVDGSTATYRNVLPQTDVELIASNDGLKEVIVLKSARAETSWVFPLRLEGLTASLGEDGSVQLRNAAEELAAWIPPGWMADSKFNPGSGEMTTSTAVTYELVEVDGGTALKVTADKEWISHPDRVFPIRVDPTTVHTSGDVFVDNLDGGPPHNGDNLPVGLCTDPVGCGSYKARSFLKFADVNAVPGMRITGASIELFHTWSWDCTTHLPVTISAVTSSWSVGGLSSLPASGYPGPSLGQTVGTLSITDNYTACTNTTGNRSTGNWRSAILNTSVFNAWADGTMTNHGLALTASESDTRSWKRFTSENHDGGSKQPRLQLTWTPYTAPQVDKLYPSSGFTVGTLQPELVAVGTGTGSLQYQFAVFDAEGNPVVNSGSWSSNPRWQVSSALVWGKTYMWYAAVTNGTQTATSNYQTFSVRVPQPLVTGGLSQNPEGPGFSAVSGNYTTTAVDALVESVGPELAITRSYNSRDPRTNGAFGAGWSSLLDAHVRPAASGGSPALMTVRYPTGQEVTFGRNPDNTWDAGSGRFAVLASNAGWELTDKEATKYTFGQSLGSDVYGLTKITDAAGRELTLTYASGKVSQITSASQRKLYVTWDGSRVESVSTDRANPADPASVSTWNYAYSSGRLESVCPPQTPTQCHTYSYDVADELSLHTTALLDAGPRSYFPLGSTDDVVDNAAIDSVHVSSAAPTPTVGQGSGPFPGSTAATFNGSSAYVELTGEKGAIESFYQSVSLWFKTPTGSTSGGVLLSVQDTVPGGSATSYTPVLYVGTDGALRAKFHTTSGGLLGPGASVNDGNWHHAVLTSTPSGQKLYLDGSNISTTTHTRAVQGTQNRVYVGAGRWTGRTSVSGDNGFFTGSIAEVALFDRELTGPEVTTLRTTGTALSRPLTDISRPSGAVAASIDYDPATGRVDSLTDGNGGTWTVGDPVPSGSDLAYVSAVLGAGPSNYWRFTQSSGLNAVNEVNGQEAEFDDVALNDEPGPFKDMGPNPPTAAGFYGNDSEVYVDDAPVDTTKGFTVTTWANLDEDDTDQFLVTMPGSIGSSAFKLLYDQSDDQWAVDMAMRKPDNSVGWQWLESGSGSVTEDTWVHLAVTSDPGAGKIRLYVDGEMVDELSPTVAFNNQATSMHLGHQYEEDYLIGELAEFATFRRALSADDVAAIYRAYHNSKGGPVKTVEVTDPMGAKRTTVYDVAAGGRLIRETDTLNETTVYGYDTGGFLYSVTDPNGNAVITGRDVRGNVVSRSTCQDQSENLCSTTYYTHWPNNDDRVLSSDARNDNTLTIRDGRSSGPGDNTYLTTYVYDSTGSNTSVTDPLGRVTTTTYSTGSGAAVGGGVVPAGLPLTVASPGGVLHSLEYYSTGDLAAAIDPSGQRTEYSYDGLGRVIEETTISDTYPAGLTTTYTYDKNGRTLTSTAPAVINRVTGATHTAKTTIEYNADGQPTLTHIEDLTGGDAYREAELSYNALGQVEWVADADGGRTYYTYDARGQQVTQTRADDGGDPIGPTIEQTFDGEGHLLTTVVQDYDGPDQDLQWEARDYDPAGRLARVVDAMGWETRYTYTDNNLPATTTRRDPSTSQSHVIESRTYNKAGYVTGTTSANNTLTITNAVDAAGRTTSRIIDPAGVNRTVAYTFNRDDHVVSTVVSDGSGSQRTDSLYDLSGNLVAQTGYPNGTTAPVGRWKLDETTGLTAADSVGNSPATAASGVTWSTDHGGSAVFNGSGNGLVTSGPVLDTTRSYTISAWAKISNLSNYYMIGSQDGTQRSGFFFGYDDSADRWALYLCDPNHPTTHSCSGGAYSTAAPTTNSWVHLTGVYDQSAGQLRLYVNGSLQDTETVSTTRPAATGPLRIGAAKWTGGPGNRFPGSIDDVQVYQAALSGSEISQIYSGAAPAAGAGVVRSSIGYDQRGLPIASTDPNGATTYFDNDEAGRLAVTTSPSVVSQEHGGSPVTAPAVSMVGYNTFGESTENRDPKGRVVTTAYNANGQPESQTLPSYTPPDGGATITGAQSLVEYDALGRVWKTTDPLGEVTERQYDLLDRMVLVETPDGEQIEYEYSLAGQVLAMVDPNGARTESTYDYLGRQLTGTEIVRQPSTTAHTTTYEYWPSGQLKKVTPPGRSATTWNYNAVGETTSVVDGAGNTHTNTYDFAGRPVKALLPGGSGSKTIYDGAGRPTAQQTLAADGTTVLATTTLAYDRAGNAVAVTNPRGHTTTLTYDALGTLTQVVEPVSALESITSSYGYDAARAPTRFTNGRGHEFWTTYNTWGLPESVIEPSTTAHSSLADRTFTTVYDRAGQAVKELLPGGVSITNTYNELGQLVTSAGAGAEVSTTTRAFDYDAAGRPTEITGSGGANTLTWDDRGLLLSATGPSGDSSYSYTGDGLLASRVDAAGTTNYTYDTAARLSTIVNSGTGVNATLQYNVRSQVDKITYTDGTNSRQQLFGYDTQHRLTSDVVAEMPPSTVELGRIDYGYDANGNITSKDTEGFAGSADNTYTYDRANRLTSWLEDNPSTTTLTEYAYDAAGNRTEVGERTFTYDQRNRLTADSDGNTYTYTARGTRATQVTPSSATLQTHSDAFGQVLRQDAPGQQVNYSYDGLGRLLETGHEYTGLGNDLATDGTTDYTRDPTGNLIGAKTSSAQRLVWTDQHTDVVGQFTPASTTLAGSATYDPFGNIQAASGLIGSLGYQSEYTDDLTGRVNMHNRWYNPDTGQFDNRDTVSVSPIPASVAANRYAYGYANPLGNTDPTGNDPGGGGGSASYGCNDQCQLRALEASVAVQERQLAQAQKDSRIDLKSVILPLGWELFKDFVGINSVVACIQGGVSACVELLIDVIPWGKIAGMLKDVWRFAERAFGAYKTWKKATEAAKTAIQTVTRTLNDARAKLNALRNKIANSVKPPSVPTPPRSPSTPLSPSVPKASPPKAPSPPKASPPPAPKPPAAKPEAPPRPAEPPRAQPPQAPKPDAGRPPGQSPGRQPDADRPRTDQPQGPSCEIPHSFDPATPVVMADGSTKRIDEVEVGDEVLATDPETDDTTAQKVTALHRNEDTELTDVTVSPQPAADPATIGEGEGDRSTRGPTTVIKTTAHHPFWDATAQEWVNASDLQPGVSTLTGPDGEIQHVTAVRNFTGVQHMHDLTVANTHTYYVMAGATPVLVHNCGDFIGPKDHVALGREDFGLEGFADQVAGRRISAGDWRSEVQAAISRVVRGEGDISFMIDGLPGANRGIAGVLAEARAAAARGPQYLMHTQWELLQVADAGVLSKVSFFRFNRRLGAWAGVS